MGPCINFKYTIAFVFFLSLLKFTVDYSTELSFLVPGKGIVQCIYTHGTS